MERDKIIEALSKAYDDVYREHHALSELSNVLLHDGEDAAYKAIARRAQSKSHMLDGIQLAAAALGITWDEPLERTNHKEAQS